jgi:hypothetical protein
METFECYGGTRSMSTDAVSVLVIGPNDLVTTSLGTALAACGFAMGRQACEATLPPAPREGGVAVVVLDATDETEWVSNAVRAGWSVLVVGRPRALAGL